MITLNLSCKRLHITDDWFDLYEEYRQRYNYVPEIYHFSPEKIVHENVPGIPLSKGVQVFSDNEDLPLQQAKDIFNKVHKNYFDLVSSFYEYSNDIGFGFYHDHLIDSAIYIDYENNCKLWVVRPENFIIRHFIDYTEIVKPMYLHTMSKHCRVHAPNDRNYVQYAPTQYDDRILGQWELK